MNSFKLKKVLIDTKDWPLKINEIREEWLISLLLSLNVPKLMIDKRQSLKISKEEWSHYLLTTFKLKIEFNIEEQTVKILKMIEKDSAWKEETIAEWNKPESIKHKPLYKKPYYEVNLKYWSLL